jgi:nucleotidyltransferase/DNA polymerase involved in DNA repair
MTGQLSRLCRRLPRTRGDRPQQAGCTQQSSRAPPHARGSTRRLVVLRSPEEGSPARAGIDPTSPSPLAERAHAVWWPPPATRRAASGCIPQWPPSRRDASVPTSSSWRPVSTSTREISRQIREIFAEYTTLIEAPSLDEAYLDVTENLKGIPFATQTAEEIRARIRQEMHLTASAGVSYNKFLAKMASDQHKPDGLFVITPEMGPGFVETLPIDKFHGIGPATAAKMNHLGILTGRDLKAQSLSFLQERFGKAGSYFHAIARGIDRRPVRPDRVRKSIGAENTFPTDLTGFEEMKTELQPILDKVWRHCEQTGVRGRTVTLKVKYADFEQITRSRSLTGHVESRSVLEQVSVDLLTALFPMRKGVRLLGVTLRSTTRSRSDRRVRPATAITFVTSPSDRFLSRANWFLVRRLVWKSDPWYLPAHHNHIGLNVSDVP